MKVHILTKKEREQVEAIPMRIRLKPEGAAFLRVFNYSEKASPAGISAFVAPYATINRISEAWISAVSHRAVSMAAFDMSILKWTVKIHLMSHGFRSVAPSKGADLCSVQHKLINHS